ncbi:hypothetical protein ALC53_12274, partial [Atta colombica]
LKYVKKSHLYLILRIVLLHKSLYTCYSDRFTPVLLIVSLAGIKVCSPDGKVSTRDAHTDTPAEKDTLRKLDRIAEYPWQKICSYSTIIFSITILCVQMAHALRRIFYATCEPQHAQFSFLAREPGAHFSLQYCHSFITESAEQYQCALRSDEVNGKVHEMLALAMNKNTAIIRKLLVSLKIIPMKA